MSSAPTAPTVEEIDDAPAEPNRAVPGAVCASRATMVGMTEWDAQADARRVLRSAEIHLTVAEQHQLEHPPHASTEVPWTVGGALEVGHDDHYIDGQSTERLEENGRPAGIWWIRRNDRGRRAIVVLPPCPVAQARPNQANRDLCLLFKGHPVRYGFLPGRAVDHLAEYVDYSRPAVVLAAQDPGAAQVAATLALAAAINRLADVGPHPADRAATSSVIRAAVKVGQTSGV